ncbi:hypothetical protein A2223_00470 [Candidatus Falkowbacteria bacterium RIFOXYA2_FULL_35_8]|nr:MAG: hypothetical protein A2300_04170 [Candidatus Falkowbacteria bacterium RIFOXYB2_FULL_35_7]OGF34143.1 MAG: hypothetical protein A2223_00470 [Candidatus Falkowbacteria bacterium RIFOXYA2_FULL_35_8]
MWIDYFVLFVVVQVSGSLLLFGSQKSNQKSAGGFDCDCLTTYISLIMAKSPRPAFIKITAGKTRVLPCLWGLKLK